LSGLWEVLKGAGPQFAAIVIVGFIAVQIIKDSRLPVWAYITVIFLLIAVLVFVYVVPPGN
jgi:hypothetical protein